MLSASIVETFVHGLDVLLTSLHTVIDAYVTAHPLVGPMLAILLVAALISIPISLTVFWAWNAVLAAKSSRAATRPAAGVTPASRAPPASSRVWCALCRRSRKVVLKLRVAGDSQWRRFVTDISARTTLAQFSAAVKERLVAVAVANATEARTPAAAMQVAEARAAKVSRLVLIPNTLLDDDEAVRALVSGNEVEVELKA